MCSTLYTYSLICGRTRRGTRERKPVARTQSAPHRRPGQAKHTLKRQTSSEALPTSDHEQEMETNEPLISSPNTVSIHTYIYKEELWAWPGYFLYGAQQVTFLYCYKTGNISPFIIWLFKMPCYWLMSFQSASIKRPPAPVPWIKVSNRDSNELKIPNEEFSLLDRVCHTCYPVKWFNSNSSFNIVILYAV